MDSDVKALYNDSIHESSGDDFDIEMAVESPSMKENEMQAEDYPFEVLCAEEIVQHMLDCIKDVNTVVQLPTTTTRILLHHFKWDKEILIDQFFDGNRDKLYADAKVVNPFHAAVNKIRQKHLQQSSSSSNECQICLMVLSSHSMTGLECNHKFCTDCWRVYLETKIMEEGEGQTISCAAHGCDILVDDVTVMRLVENTKVKLKYQRLITNSFVECNRLLKWCPSPNCNFAIRVLYVESRPVTCSCRHMFCFACGENWHDPIECNVLKRWAKERSDDLESSSWIVSNTKECPNCHIKIEKNGGCNHMTCRNKNCRINFCWLCLSDWNNHSGNCNSYNVEAKIARDKEALQRFMFYRNRYISHMESLKFEHALYASVREKMEVMQEFNMSKIEVQFLEKAVDILCQCRLTVTYSYVFAFYIRQNNQSLIFEDNQKDLESATEKLSEYLEREITLENLADIKQNVKDKSRYCDTRRKVLLQHVQEGHEKAWWEYMEKI